MFGPSHIPILPTRLLSFLLDENQASAFKESTVLQLPGSPFSGRGSQKEKGIVTVVACARKARTRITYISYAERYTASCSLLVRALDNSLPKGLLCGPKYSGILHNDKEEIGEGGMKHANITRYPGAFAA
eukprot:g51842.t1